VLCEKGRASAGGRWRRPRRGARTLARRHHPHLHVVGAGNPVTAPGLARLGAKRGGRQLWSCDHSCREARYGGLSKNNTRTHPRQEPARTPRLFNHWCSFPAFYIPFYPTGVWGAEGVVFLRRGSGGYGRITPGGGRWSWRRAVGKRHRGRAPTTHHQRSRSELTQRGGSASTAAQADYRGGRSGTVQRWRSGDQPPQGVQCGRLRTIPYNPYGGGRGAGGGRHQRGGRSASLDRTSASVPTTCPRGGKDLCLWREPHRRSGGGASTRAMRERRGSR